MAAALSAMASPHRLSKSIFVIIVGRFLSFLKILANCFISHLSSFPPKANNCPFTLLGDFCKGLPVRLLLSAS